MNNKTRKLGFFIILLLGVFVINTTFAHQCTNTCCTQITPIKYAFTVTQSNNDRYALDEQSPLKNNENNSLTFTEVEDEDDSNDETPSEKSLKENKYLSAQNYFSSFIYDHFLRHAYSGVSLIYNYHPSLPLRNLHIFILFSVIRI